MLRSVFDRELKRLQDALLDLGDRVAEALVTSADALLRGDQDTARRLIAGDALINERRFAIESGCLTLIATQQPAAGDMRVLAAILEIATELERTGDYAKGLGRITVLIGDHPVADLAEGLPRMARMAADMLRRALVAFANRDVETARAIPREDDAVDALYNDVYRRVIEAIVADSSRVDTTSQLLWAAHNLERAADRVSNICERTIYMVTGEMKELDSEDGLLPGAGGQVGTLGP